MGCGQSKAATDPTYNPDFAKRRPSGERPSVGGQGPRGRVPAPPAGSRNGSRSDTELYSDLASRSAQGHPTSQRVRAGSRMDGRPGSRPTSGRLREPEVLRPISSRMREQELGYAPPRPSGVGYLVREPLSGGTAVLPPRGASLRMGDERDARRPPSTRMRDDYVSPQYRSLADPLPMVPGSDDDYTDSNYAAINAPPPLAYEDEFFSSQQRARGSVRNSEYYAPPPVEYRDPAAPDYRDSSQMEYDESYGHSEYYPPSHPLPGIPVGITDRRASAQTARSRSPEAYDRRFSQRNDDPYGRRISSRGNLEEYYEPGYVPTVPLTREESRQSRVIDRDQHSDYPPYEYERPYNSYDIPRPPAVEFPTPRYEYDYDADGRPQSSIRQPMVVDDSDWYRRPEGPRRRPSMNSVSRRDAELDESHSSGGRFNAYGRARVRDDDEMSNLSFESSRSNRTPPMIKMVNRSKNDSPRNSPVVAIEGFTANEVNRIMHLHQAEIYRLYGTALFSPSVTGSTIFTEADVKQMLDDQLERHSSLIKASDPSIVPPVSETIIAKYRAAPRKRDSFDSVSGQRENSTAFPYGQEVPVMQREGMTRPPLPRKDSQELAQGRRTSFEGSPTPAPSLPRKESSEFKNQAPAPLQRRDSDRNTTAHLARRDAVDGAAPKLNLGAPVARPSHSRDERLTVAQVNAMLVKQTAAIFDDLGAVLYCPPLVGAGTFSPELAEKILADKRRMQTTFETKPLFSSLEVNSFLEQQVSYLQTMYHSVTNPFSRPMCCRTSLVIPSCSAQWRTVNIQRTRCVRSFESNLRST